MPIPPESPILLLGASGILGRHLASALAPEMPVMSHLERARAGSKRFDARTMDVASLWQDRAAPPSTAIVMLGITSIDACARDPQGTALTNVDATIRTIEQLCLHGVVPVFVSSDGVFDGSRAWWDEGDAVRPILEYGRQKFAVERYMATLHSGLVVRLPKLLDGPGDGGGMIAGWLEALGRDAPLLCATDQYFTPLAAGEAARAILQLVSCGARGLCHVAGVERLSRRDLLAQVMEEFRNFAEVRAPVLECGLADLPVFETRPLDTSMCTRRLAQEFGCRPQPAGEAARQAVQAHFKATAA